ncbi:peptide/nickel transport system ATP-binding protein/oligopeptide transport system ATP-binding protein [Clostridium amylolyticum]|uniref:Peptide/nickel transport system ATP-binding protein/oligopeptide transport system ATP-binding protein n=1 Tax=Clostridium amylolyticum TaxID=1121298 RepID=A0A1M6PHI7_9CLOT|nr:ABC transporter ATP-binding protein [Clostridium amylolyticum]SHK07419.1 peptide/nickel transport system ATP-binding protein/oligopeptide transport system ATP-binding protein [Clostridium amylolyticum]
MLLQVKNLKTKFNTKKGIINAVNGVDFDIEKGEVVAVVGESGSGKSVTSLSIMGLLSEGRTSVEGEILFKSENLLAKSKREFQDIRGNQISMIFQEPMTSLNPVFTIGRQISEALIRHEKLTKKQAEEKAIEMLDLVGIPSPEKRLKNYPHQMSGGMRQRVMIAMALACNPELLIADEPTTALDVTIQAQILELMINLKEKLGTSILLITHDLGVVAETADRVVVMYCGKVVEKGTVDEIFNNPQHPYTKGLLNSIPKVEEKEEKLFMIPGMVPNPLNLPSGCAFSDRCSYCKDICKVKEPSLIASKDREVRCFLYSEKEGA